jgi:hypothetical protein
MANSPWFEAGAMNSLVVATGDSLCCALRDGAKITAEIETRLSMTRRNPTQRRPPLPGPLLQWRRGRRPRQFMVTMRDSRTLALPTNLRGATNRCIACIIWVYRYLRRKRFVQIHQHSGWENTRRLFKVESLSAKRNKIAPHFGGLHYFVYPIFIQLLGPKPHGQ